MNYECIYLMNYIETCFEKYCNKWFRFVIIYEIEKDIFVVIIIIVFFWTEKKTDVEYDW